LPVLTQPGDGKNGRRDPLPVFRSSGIPAAQAGMFGCYRCSGRKFVTAATSEPGLA
jgi:hypothetical protein